MTSGVRNLNFAFKLRLRKRDDLPPRPRTSQHPRPFSPISATNSPSNIKVQVLTGPAHTSPKMFALRRLPHASAPAIRSFSTTSTRSSFAKISIIGHLAATPEVQATSTGRELVKYAVATNSGPKDNRTTSWWNVASFAPEGAFRDILTSLPKG